MSEIIETVNQAAEYLADSPCATGNCSLPNNIDPVGGFDLDEYVKDVELPTINKGDLVIFNLRGKVRSGKVISKGKVHLGIDTIGMKRNTKIPATTEFVPMTVFVKKAVLDSLESKAE